MSNDSVQPTPVLAVFPAYGRYYGLWRQEKYLFPIDAEETNRMDMFHQFFLVARHDALYLPNLPVTRSLRIMDLGTGTGIWANHVAESRTNPEPEIMAVDLHKIQAENHLLPGSGYLEHVEIDWVPRWDEGDGGEIPVRSALEEWSTLFFTALERLGRNARIDRAAIRKTIEDAGFTDFKEETIRGYMGPWMPDKNEQIAAKWLNLCFSRGVEAMSLMPMIKGLGMDMGEVSRLCERAVKETLQLRFHTYFNVCSLPV
ncbi:methyltransferase LaeA [Metarhizium acridum CQMa 102]|uniref:Methyltransferase LaeA n=1 Tax=Metarhizium acridum (strain CQMa 102) TaxID=655827 RepID=E9E8K3_METAQ|nr:methyltransferase LaeA [Metarhizium acridum CQMa 102]EFY87732.1 methyltransferase LaeA [Metarhizium acridum CQMa 102]